MKFKVHDDVTSDGYHKIEIIEGRFEGITFSYGRVEFLDNDDDPILSYKYNIHSGALPLDSQKEFEDTIGSILHGLIKEQLANNQIVYGGGTE